MDLFILCIKIIRSTAFENLILIKAYSEKLFQTKKELYFE